MLPFALKTYHIFKDQIQYFESGVKQSLNNEKMTLGVGRKTKQLQCQDRTITDPWK